MESQATIDTLNGLLAAEHASLAQRFSDVGSHVSLPLAGDHLLVQRMHAACLDHQRALTERIVSLRGVPGRLTMPTSTGELHFLDLSYLVPRVIGDLRRLVKAYETASVADAETGGLIRRILETHRKHLAALERVHSELPIRPAEAAP